ncbi:hypothetical protein [Dyella sp. 2RAB6]|uniref:hypothetical protein n=1 Tax=Dyella sp. 2RAB6 TaxID=3232992 RepID=UPI003F90F055
MANQPQDPKQAARRDNEPKQHEPTPEGAAPIQTPGPAHDASDHRAREAKDDQSVQGDEGDASRRQNQQASRIVTPSDPNVIQGAPPKDDAGAVGKKHAKPDPDEEQ